MKKTQYTVVIPTRRSATSILPTIVSIKSQIEQPVSIVIVLDKTLTKQQLQAYKTTISDSEIKFISHIENIFQTNKGVSYVRNCWLSYVETDLVMFVDDDNVFKKDFCLRLIKARELQKKTTKKEALLVPTELYKNKIRSRGYVYFNYRLWKQKPCKNTKQPKILWNEKVCKIQFASSNCLFGSTKMFQKISFDERFEFIYEDFDMTRRLTKAWFDAFVLLELYINHQMRPKTSLEDSYISTPKDVFQKSKNRILFVKNTGTFREKIDYFVLWLRIHTLFLIYKILYHTTKYPKKKLLKELIRWIWVWLFN